MRNKRLGTCTVKAPPSNLERVGPEYAQYVKRSMAWIRRRGTIVHDWRTPSKSLWNPNSLLSTVYAFPEALSEMETEPNKFGLWV